MAERCLKPLLLEQQSEAECISGVTFGCYGTPVEYMLLLPGSSAADLMWVDGGCHGRFHCGRTQKLMHCGKGQSGRHNCSCIKQGKKVRRPILAATQDVAPKTVEQLPAVYLAPYWHHRGIYRADVGRAEQWLSQQSRYVAPGAFRAKLINGSLWIKMIQV